MAKTLCAASLHCTVVRWGLHVCSSLGLGELRQFAGAKLSASQAASLIWTFETRTRRSRFGSPGPNGPVKEWFIEWSNRNALVRRKLPFQLLRVGDTVTINASPSRRLDNLAYFRSAVLPDKSVLRDCGFEAFRQAIAKGQFIECEPGRPSGGTSPPES